MSQTQPSPGPVESPSRRFGLEESIFAGLFILAIGGIAIADFSSRQGLDYWLAMVPIFAVASTFIGWNRARKSAGGRGVFSLLRDQLLHWAALALTVYLIYLLQATGRLNRDDAGLVTLLALALTTVLAGVHFDWRLLVLGALLAVTAACSALVEEFFWMLAIPALLLGVGAFLWQRHVRRGPDAPPAPPASPAAPTPPEEPLT